MKTAIVPAQITTIEDKIAGNLGLSQLLLLVAPIFISALLYFLLPPSSHDATYKIVGIVLIMVSCALLAIRVKGKLILNWLVVLVRYNLRPCYYVFDKNSSAYREQNTAPKESRAQAEPQEKVLTQRQPMALSPAEITNLHSLMDSSIANLVFKNTKKGGLHVLITKIEEKS
jgi:hypothetical protein